MIENRSNESDDQLIQRLEQKRLCLIEYRSNECDDPDQRIQRLEQERLRII